MLKDAAVSLSLANLCMINMWHHFLYRAPGSSDNDYFLKVSPYNITVYAALIDVLLLGVVIFPFITLVNQKRRAPRMLARFVVLGMLFFATYHVLLLCSTSFAGTYLAADDKALSFAVALLVMLLLYFLWDRKPAVGEFIKNSLLFLLPFVLITFLHAGWHLARGDAAFCDKPLAPPIRSASSSARILWFIFDEMDQRQTFEERLPGLRLPQLDRFRRESLYATNAFPPASWTIRSLPALLTGKRISKAEPLSSDELAVTYCADRRTAKWSHEPNVFSRARRMGFETAVIGGYHPYCRVISRHVSRCFWEPWDPFDISPERTLQATMIEHFMTSFDLFMGYSRLHAKRVGEIRAEALRGVLHEVQYHAGVYMNVVREARKVITDPTIGLVLIHWPVPHPPSIYDRDTQRLRDSAINVTDSSYADNLELVDRTLAIVRQDLEASGRWEGATIILSSDHWLRKSLWRFEGEVDRRIPFMVKLAGQKSGAVYERPFNTVLTQDLILAILRGEITSMEGMAAWLDGNGSTAEGSCGYQDDVE
ncbi:MAG TPA: hypothetical protein VMT71_04905 [Syntrophorhabdales bacterium]|nr:hypothetical protein [Syntrophorhabdales bacterium]